MDGLLSAAEACLRCEDAKTKVALTQYYFGIYRQIQLSFPADALNVPSILEPDRPIKGPFNKDARLRAEFSVSELARLEQRAA